MSKRTINEHIARANAIPGDIRAIIKGTKLDTGVYLDSLKGMEPDDQRATSVKLVFESKLLTPML